MLSRTTVAGSGTEVTIFAFETSNVQESKLISEAPSILNLEKFTLKLLGSGGVRGRTSLANADAEESIKARSRQHGLTPTKAGPVMLNKLVTLYLS